MASYGTVANARRGMLESGSSRRPLNVLNAALAASRRSVCSSRPATTQANSTFYRPATGWSARASLVFDFASNTAYGPLLGHIGIQDDMGNGFDSLTPATPTAEHHVCRPGLPDLGRDHRR